MTTYRKIHGRSIQAVTTDPTESVAEGQIWYNTTSDTFKSVVAIEAWASASPQTQAQRDGGYGQSTPSTASWFAGGVDPARNSTTTQEFNGSGWSNGGNINVGREEATGFGLVSAATLAGGATYPPSALKNEVEEYDGSSWTAVTALPAKRKQAAGAGTQTAGLVSFGAVDPPAAAGSINATALEYNGSSWTSGGTGNTARSQISGCGTQTAALAFGGHTSPSTTYPAATEEYDGSSWTTGGTMNTGRGLMACNGIQTSALAYAGFQPYKSNSEKYDGTTWSNTPSLATARDRAHGGGPNSSNGLCAGGLTSPGVVSVVEEFTSSANVITAAAWSSGGNLNTARRDGASAGNATAHSNALYFSGYEPANSAKSEAYDGTSWSEGPDLSTGRGGARGFGVNTAAVCCAGGNPPAQNVTEEYNGSAWTAGGNLNLGRTSHNAFGTLTAGVASGGNEVGPAGNTTATELYNGTSWTTSPATLPTAMHQGGIDGAGSQTAGLVAGGDGPGSPTTAAYEFDGEAWTAGGSLITGAEGAGMNGTQTSAFFTGGNNGGAIATTQNYDGTSWSTRPSISTARYYTNGSGATAPATLLIGGWNGSANLATTEEFTGETSAANITDFTTS